MLKFDRIVLVVLALGIWALVLSPREIGAQASREADALNEHSCDIFGDAYVELRPVIMGAVEAHRIKVDTSGLTVDCSHS